MPYKQVVAFGDSFTRGDELTNCKDQIERKFTKTIHFSESTWPALVAKQLSADYDCIAVGGKGNQWISYRVSQALRKLKDCLVIINWSWFERFDYIDIAAGQWAVTHPRHEHKLDNYFYKHLDSEQWNCHRNLQQIHSTINLLRNNKTHFIMTCLDPMLHLHYDETASLYSQVKDFIVDFSDYTFLEWAKHKNFAIGPNGHPLEKAHAEAAKYINMKITEGKINGH